MCELEMVYKKISNGFKSLMFNKIVGVKALVMISAFYSPVLFALEDDLKKAIEIATYASKFQSERMKVAAENLANIDSASDVPGGNPYRRKIIFAQNKYDKRLKTNVLQTKKIDVDRSDFILKYEPTHPAADDLGYVKYPNVNKLIEKADASEAMRGYEADLGIIEMSNSLIGKTIEAIK